MRPRAARLRAPLAAAALTLTTSCDFAYLARGVVVRPDGAPVEGATVSMLDGSCDAKRKPSKTTVTEADGSYMIGYVGAFPMGKVTVGIEIAKDGFEPVCQERILGPPEPVRQELRPVRQPAAPR